MYQISLEILLDFSLNSTESNEHAMKIILKLTKGL
jgi:hypothetical protein